MSTPPTEVLFYHLERHPLERVLPGLLERTLERGWRAVVQVGSEERLDVLDTHLWTYSEESFLPHASARTGNAERQPIVLLLDESNPNGAGVRFLVDGARIARFEGYVRIVLIFDGRDPEAVAEARAQWRLAKAQGCALTYWQQTETGGWERKA